MQTVPIKRKIFVIRRIIPFGLPSFSYTLGRFLLVGVTLLAQTQWRQKNSRDNYVIY